MGQREKGGDSQRGRWVWDGWIMGTNTLSNGAPRTRPRRPATPSSALWPQGSCSWLGRRTSATLIPAHPASPRCTPCAAATKNHPQQSQPVPSLLPAPLGSLPGPFGSSPLRRILSGPFGPLPGSLRRSFRSPFIQRHAALEVPSLSLLSSVICSSLAGAGRG